MEPLPSSWARRGAVLPLFGLLGVFGAAPADGPKPEVVLTLETVTATRAGGDTVFACRATLENNTGADLKVRSNFFSAFDGLLLVVRDEGGKELTKQPYVFHQAPRAKDTDHPLPVGKTTADLVFPVAGLPERAGKLKVQLVGSLPGSGYEPGLASGVLEVQPKAE